VAERDFIKAPRPVAQISRTPSGCSAPLSRSPLVFGAFCVRSFRAGGSQENRWENGQLITDAIMPGRAQNSRGASMGSVATE
jgi:hypothetical protein